MRCAMRGPSICRCRFRPATARWPATAWSVSVRVAVGVGGGAVERRERGGEGPPPLRTEFDRAAIRAALADGTIDAICSDHAPMAQEDKLLPFGEASAGASGLETMLALLLGWAASSGIGMLEALAPVTAGPARVLAEDTGTMLVGRKADLVIFDPQETWPVSADTLLSSGKNTPYLECELTGRVRTTIVGGEVRVER